MSQADHSLTTRRAFIGGVAAIVPAAAVPVAAKPALEATETLDRELVKLVAEYRRLNTLNPDPGLTPKEDEEFCWDVFYETQDVIEEAIEIPAQSPIGLLAKIQMFDGITDQLAGSGDTEAMWASLCSDIRRLAGVSDQV